MKTPEGKIKDDIRKWLRAEGYYFFCPVQQGYGQQALDIYACNGDGQFVAIEVKAPGKKPTARQSALMQEITDKGGIAMLAHSVQDVMDFF